MFCPHCGTQLPDGSAFCAQCGAGLEAAAPPPAPQAPAPPPAPTAVMPTAHLAPPAGPAQATAGSPYPKAPLGARLIALLADGIIAGALLPVAVLLIMAAGSRGEFSAAGVALAVIGGLWQTGYTLGRDAAGGAGWGKRLTGLVVVSVDTAGLAPAGATVLRQVVLWALGIVPVIGSLIEPVLVLTNPQGRRLGDKAAKTQVVRASDAQARGLTVTGGRGVAIGALVAALLVSVIGGVAGGVVFARSVAGAALPQTETPAAPTPTPEETPAEEESPGSLPGGDVAGAVNPETAVDAVGNLLNHLKNNDVESARGYATRRFKEDDAWFFAPADGALANFEVVNVFQDQAIWVVEVDEDWISGPQRSRYFVIEEDNTARVDGVEFLDR